VGADRPPQQREGAIRTFIRVNHKIRVPKVRLIDADGNMVGVVATRDGLKMALDRNLDLVEVSPMADPPVCRIMDYGKFRYDESIKEKEARKKAHKHVVKEVKFHANVAEHDFMTKVGHIRGFLQKGQKVKLTLTFRGRENAHRELGFEVVKRVIATVSDIGTVEQDPKLLGRNIVALLGVRNIKMQPKSLDATPPVH